MTGEDGNDREDGNDGEDGNDDYRVKAFYGDEDT